MANTSMKTPLHVLVLGALLSCGGETSSPAPAPAVSTCRDEAHREADVNDVTCDEHARIEFTEGWILCKCGKE